jgi:WD40 repeat protein
MLKLNSDEFLSLSIDKKVCLWNTKINLPELIVTTNAAPTKLLNLKKAKKILIPNWDNSFSIVPKLSILKRKPTLTTLTGHSSWVLHACEMNKENTIATCSRDKTIRIWNIDSNILLMTLEDHTDIVNYVIPLDNDELLSCSSDFTIKLWDTETPRCINTIKDGDLPVFQMIKLDNDTLITRSESNYNNIWNYRTGELVRSFHNHYTNVICMIMLKNL